MYHEMKWGLPVRENLSYEERRRLIYQKRDFKAPMTPYRMESYIANVCGFKAQVSDIHDPGEYDFYPEHPNIFRVDFVGDGTLDMKTVRAMLNGLKQSHTIWNANDRVIVILDNQNIEKVYIPEIIMKVRLPFWQKKLLDGSWNLDGSALLNAILQQMNIGMQNRMVVVNVQERLEASMILKKNEWYLDGMQLMDGSRAMNAEITEEGL